MIIEQRKHDLHVAVVYAPDGIRLLTAALSEEVVAERLAAHIDAQADFLLWPADAHQVRVLLETGDTEEAIALYFGRVGERWEREYLHREEAASVGLAGTDRRRGKREQAWLRRTSS